MKKIDTAKMAQLLRAGKSQREIARFFQVTPGAVSIAKKNLGIAVTKNVVMASADKIVSKNLNAVAQLQGINDQTKKIINNLSDSSDNADRELILKACREIRGQLSLQLEIFKTLYDLEAVQEFQQEVLSIIGEVDPSVRTLIIDRLKEKRAIRAAIDFD